MVSLVNNKSYAQSLLNFNVNGKVLPNQVMRMIVPYLNLNQLILVSKHINGIVEAAFASIKLSYNQLLGAGWDRDVLVKSTVRPKARSIELEEERKGKAEIELKNKAEVESNVERDKKPVKAPQPQRILALACRQLRLECLSLNGQEVLKQYGDPTRCYVRYCTLEPNTLGRR